MIPHGHRRRHTLLRIMAGRARAPVPAGPRLQARADGRPRRRVPILPRHLLPLGAALGRGRRPVKFWKELTALLDDAPPDPPADAKAALVHGLPARGLASQFRVRPRVGMGSLGKPRYAALAEWAGGWVAREAKAATPPAT